ncbi:hypothetical protein ACOJR9_17090 [Alteromonas sp. A081]|uniref:hypothetical protein n=1 Tax=Alteromonas sp. A081 TaxID=3410269 RepID=UPI003B9823DB
MNKNGECENMTERRLIRELTEVCEGLKKQDNGFVWLTHLGHWRNPEIVAVFDTEIDRNRALEQNWETTFITQVEIALEGIKSKPVSVRFDSEEACAKQSQGDWERHLARNVTH